MCTVGCLYGLFFFLTSSGAEANFYDELVGLPRHMLRPADDGEELGTHGEENEVGDKVRLLHPPHPHPCMLLPTALPASP